MGVFLWHLKVPVLSENWFCQGYVFFLPFSQQFVADGVLWQPAFGCVYEMVILHDRTGKMGKRTCDSAQCAGQVVVVTQVSSAIKTVHPFL